MIFKLKRQNQLPKKAIIKTQDFGKLFCESKQIKKKKNIFLKSAWNGC